MNFADSLNKILDSRGLKQADLCRMSGLPTAMVSNYCNGKKIPTLTSAIAMADALQISLDELSGCEPPKRDLEQELLNHFRELNEEGQEVAVNTVSGLKLAYKKRNQHQVAKTA